ncbi:hypothetical protein [Oryzobacter telluris]|uniref:hypothetical protein n=1 Tax=Oryzobacter telluris TaxID=3149179 RepID=UPI00370DC4B9
MTPDLMEERLRSALSDATSAQDGAWLDLDPALVLGRGRRAVLRRRVAAGVSVAAATAVVGLVGWSALGSTVDRTSTPAGSSSSVRTGTAQAVLRNESGTAPEGSGVVSDTLVRFTLDRATGRITYSAQVDGSMEVVAEGRLPVSPRGGTWVTPENVPGLVVGVLPEAAKDQVFVWAGDAPGAASSTAVLDGTGFQAFAVWHSGTRGSTTFAGMDWTDGDAVYRSDGSRVTSRLDGDVVAFVDEKQGLFGLFGDGSSGTKRLADVPDGAPPVMMLGHQRDGADALTNAVLVILPAGATDVVATAKVGATVTATSTLVDRSIEPTLVIVRLTVPTLVGGTGVQKVSWTGADGQPVATEVGF